MHAATESCPAAFWNPGIGWDHTKACNAQSLFPRTYAHACRYLDGSQYGNVVVWISLFLGQPMAIMLYVHDYLAVHNITVQ